MSCPPILATSLPQKFRLPTPFVETAFVLISAVLLALLYWRTAHSLVLRWNVDPSWSHGYAVVLAFPFMMWHVGRRAGTPWRPEIPLSDWATGAVTFSIALLLHGTSRLGVNVEWLDGAGFVVLVLGTVWIIGGRVAARSFGTTVLFLLFMVPWPFSWQQSLAESLQHLVSITAQGALTTLGIPVHRVGYLLMLPGQTVEVAEGCSGLRQITVFFALSAFIGLMSGQRGLCAVLLLLSLPVAIAANTLRITATGLLLVTAGPESTTGLLHDLEGLVTFAIGFGLLWGTASRLRRFGGPRVQATASSTALPVHPGVGDRGTEGARERATLLARRGSEGARPGLTLQFRLAGLAAGLALAVCLDWQFEQSAAASGRIATIPLTAPLEHFPLELGDWQGADTPVQNSTFLYGDAHLNRIYRDQRTGQSLTVWMVYTSDGRDRAHHPEVCMRAVGCLEQPDQRAALPVDGDEQSVQRLFFNNPDGRSGQWVYYWYYVFRDADPPASPTIWQRLSERAGRKRSGITIEVFAPQDAGAEVDRIDDFVRRLDRALQIHLPERAVRGSSRGAYLMIGGPRVTGR